MPRTFVLILLSVCILFCFAQENVLVDRSMERKEFQAAESLFQRAESLYMSAGENVLLQEKADAGYLSALNAFEKLIEKISTSGFDSLNILANLRAGLIHYYLDNQQDAQKFYLSAFMSRPKAVMIPDSVFFVPYIYTGGIYHNSNQYDSALYFYNLAAGIQDTYANPLPESERLYNRLGVMLYENGNFRQARNYFEKAIELTDQSNQDLLTNYRINIASILVKLEDYKKAQEIYESALPSGLYTNEINHNLGIIHLRLHEPREALAYLKITSYPDNRKSLDLFYNYAMSYSMLGEKDSSLFYFQRAVAENIKWNGSRKNIPYGLLLKFKGDQLNAEGKYEEASRNYQLAIHQFHPGFIDPDPRVNPLEFGEAYSYINLFQTLTAKAEAFYNWYTVNNRTEDLVSSLDAYESAFRLAHFIERTYDSDEARLFLNRIKHSAHHKPIDVCIRLYRLTDEKKYLESAYDFDQRNKASVLSLSMQENELRAEGSSPLIRKEALLRSLVTRLNLKAANTTDTAMFQTLAAEIRDAEIELGKIQEQISALPEYSGKLLTEDIPAIDDIQKKLDNKTALVSWHLSEKDLLALIIRGNKFTYQLTRVDPDFIMKLDSFRMQLQLADPMARYGGKDLAVQLYKILIHPLQSELNNMERIIIIPDDELSYIPFEALQDEKQNYLLDKFSVQYQFSTHFISRTPRNNDNPGILAFAPFALHSYSDSSGEKFDVLPASREEVSSLHGSIMIDSVASKKNFLAAANKYGTLHLATHATVNNQVPWLSYIAFYPGDDDYKLYAREIYDLRLDSTDLVILSACETGMGKLIKGEGLMSLSRAFAFAGCPNIIMSLWKAEDKTTSYLTQKLHYYLDKDYTKDEALRHAKKDLLDDETIDPRFKTPNYWAHLMFIGEYEKKRAANTWLWLFGTFLFLSVMYLVVKKLTKKQVKS